MTIIKYFSIKILRFVSIKEAQIRTDELRPIYRTQK
jgi:hypothetical protein